MMETGIPDWGLMLPDVLKDYLERYRNGDLKAKDVLIERNLRLVAHVVRKYQTAEDEMDDLISIGTIGLIKAVSTFDGNRNSKLGTYAAKCIENAMLTSGHLRRKNFRRCGQNFDNRRLS